MANRPHRGTRRRRLENKSSLFLALIDITLSFKEVSSIGVTFICNTGKVAT